MFKVNNVAGEVEVEGEDRAEDEGSEFVCRVTEGEEGGFWKGLRMSTLVSFGVGVDEGAGASGLDINDSSLGGE